MSTQHTPAPWRVAPMKYCTGYAIWAGTPGGADDYRVGGVGLTNVAGQAEANARLMAAAPELLEALQTLLPHIADKKVTYHATGKVLHLGDIARAAIAKATGGEA